MALGQPAAEVGARVREGAGREERDEEPARPEAAQVRRREALGDVGGRELGGAAPRAAALHGAEGRVGEDRVEPRRIEREPERVAVCRPQPQPGEDVPAARVELVGVQADPIHLQEWPREASGPGARLQHGAHAGLAGHQRGSAFCDRQRRRELRLRPGALRQGAPVEPLLLPLPRRADPLRQREPGELPHEPPVRGALHRVVDVV